jgi:hypothetical protein
VRTGALLVAVTAALSLWWGMHFGPTPDEGAVLTNAAKILDGGVFYRDIDAYPYPASNYGAAAAMAIFGEHLRVARAFAAILFCVVVGSLYAAARPLLGARRAAVFGASLLGFKLLGFPIFTVYNYADFSFAFACLALPFLLDARDEGRARRMFVAGVCLALSFGSKQNLGLYLAAAVAAQLALPRVFLRADLPTARRDLGAFALGLGAILLPIFGYFAAHGVLGAMLHSGFVRPFTGYVPVSSIPASYMLEWWNFGALHADNTAPVYLPLLPMHVLRHAYIGLEALHPLFWALLEVFARLAYTALPIAFAIPFWRWLRSWRGGEVPPVAFLALAQLAFGFALSAFPRADWSHIVNVYPVLLLMMMALYKPGRAGVRAEIAGVALLLVVTSALTFAMTRRMTHALDLERANVWVEPKDAWLQTVVRQVRARVPEGGAFFVYGHEAFVYFLSDRYNAWPFAQLYPGQTGPGRGEAVAELLERERPYLVYGGLRGWPGSPSLEHYLRRLDRYLNRHFEPVPDFWERHPPPGPLPYPGLVEMRQPRREGLPTPAGRPTR